MKRWFGMAVLMSALCVVGANAQVLVTYDTVITNAFGASPETFPIGSRVVISYVIDSVPDSNPDPNIGHYFDPVVAMWISFPDIEKHVSCGPPAYPGDAGFTVSNDVVTSTGAVDGAFISCGQVIDATTVGGQPVAQVDMEFDDVVSPGSTPGMVSSDALPLYPLTATHSYLLIHTPFPGGITQLTLAQRTSQAIVTYDAVVRTGHGPNIGLFPDGSRIQITYSLGRLAVDTHADPTLGSYRNALLNLSVTFPDSGLFANGGPPRSWAHGGVFVNNDGVLPSGANTDQVTMTADPLGSSSLLGGEAITLMTLNLFDYPDAPAESVMISSDSLPLHELRASDPAIRFRTASGDTWVHFTLVPAELLQILTDDVDRLVTNGTLTPESADRLVRSLEAAGSSIAKNNTGSACSHLRTFVRRVQDEIDSGSMPAAVGQQLIEHAQQLQSRLGC